MTTSHALHPTEIIDALDAVDAFEVHGGGTHGRITRTETGFQCRFPDGEIVEGTPDALCEKINRMLGLSPA